MRFYASTLDEIPLLRPGTGLAVSKYFLDNRSEFSEHIEIGAKFGLTPLDREKIKAFPMSLPGRRNNACA